MKNTRILTLIFVLAFLTLLVGCLPQPTNQVPVITSVPITAVDVGEVYTYDVNATDPDGDTLTYSLDVKPTNMSISSTTGLINWTPTAEGDYAVVVKVSDGDLDITQSFTITVSEEEPGVTPTPPRIYTITATADTGGSISPSGAVKVIKGSDKKFTITPAVFYEIDLVLVDGQHLVKVPYTFTNVTANHTIHATFLFYKPVYNQDKGTHYDTIQEAIDDAGNPSETILVMAGIYNENINIDKSLTIVSVDGAEVTIIDAQGAEFAVLINGADTIATFDGFTVENYDTVGILGGAFSTVIEGVELGEDPIEVHILNNIVKEPTLEPPHNNNIQIGDGTTGTIIGNEVFGALLESPDWSGSGIIVAGSSNVLISNNHVHNSEGGIQIIGYTDYRDAPAEDNIIEYNLVENNESGIVPQMNSIGTIIRYNDVFNNDEGIAVMAIDYSWEHSTPSGTQIRYNNIVDNVNYGVKSGVWGSDTGTVLAEQVDATLNWWGNINGPSYDSVIFGDKISDNVNYIPWSTTPN